MFALTTLGVNPLNRKIQALQVQGFLFIFTDGMTIQQIKNIATPILQRHKVTKAAIFGSMADGTFTDKSDIDILVELDDSYSLLDFVGIKLDLEEALHRSVDLVEYRAVKPALKKYILENPVPIYG